MALQQPKKQRKIPMRQCMGCSEHKPKSELLRVVASADGTVSFDLTGKRSGRGAYICKDKKCLAKARKSNRLEKVLECTVPDEVYEKLMSELEGNEE